MQDLRVSLIQTTLHWESIEANLAMLEEKIWALSKQTDVIVLPEMFSTGFSMNTALAEPMNSKTFRWMKQMAEQTQAAVAGSYLIKVEGNYFNRLFFVQPDGQFTHYDKRHLFRMGREQEVFSPGNAMAPIISYKGWRIKPIICYDLRFPVWCRNGQTADTQYDVLLCVANWPSKRVNAWDSLLMARAIENQAYVVGVNRVGKDGNGIEHNGHSAVINSLGEYLFYRQDWDKVKTLYLSYTDLVEHRSQFPVGLDADIFSINL